jgi:metallo-beta-lactamase class B
MPARGKVKKILKEREMRVRRNHSFGFMVVAGALIVFGSIAGLRASPQTASGGVNAPPPGGYKSNLKERYTWSVKPFRVIGNIYYVGLSRNESWLITTPQGHFLMNQSVPEEVSKNIEELGFKVKDIKYLLSGHAHMSHVFGLARFKELTGAKVLAMQGDVAALGDGGESEDFLPDMLGPVYMPVKVDQVLHDGEKIQLGGVTMVAHLTPGHTRGCTTWTTEAEEKGKKYTVVLYGACSSMNQPLVGKNARPGIAEDFENQYKTLRSLHGDVLLGGVSLEALLRKVELREKNPATNPFIDPKGYEEFVARNEKLFRDQLQKERAGGGAFPIVIGDSGSCPKGVRACYSYYDLIMECCKKIGARYVGKN